MGVCLAVVRLFPDCGGAVFIDFARRPFEQFLFGKRFAGVRAAVGAADFHHRPSECIAAARNGVFPLAGGLLACAGEGDGAGLSRHERYGGLGVRRAVAGGLGLPGLGGLVGAGTGYRRAGLGFADRRLPAGGGGGDAVCGLDKPFHGLSGLGCEKQYYRPARPAQSFGALPDVGPAFGGMVVVPTPPARPARRVGGAVPVGHDGAGQFAHDFAVCSRRRPAGLVLAVAAGARRQPPAIDYFVCAGHGGGGAVFAERRLGLAGHQSGGNRLAADGGQLFRHVRPRPRMAQRLARVSRCAAVGARLGQLSPPGLPCRQFPQRFQPQRHQRVVYPFAQHRFAAVGRNGAGRHAAGIRRRAVGDMAVFQTACFRRKHAAARADDRQPVPQHVGIPAVVHLFSNRLCRHDEHHAV